MPRSRWLWLVATLALLWPPPAGAQERRTVTLGSAEAPVSVFADRIENLERDRLLIAEGRVEIEQGDVRLEADRVEVNTETGEAVATGRVVFFDGRDRLTGERLEYNLRTGTGIVYRADGVAEPHFFFGADRMERFGDKAYRLTRGVFTTCEDEEPAWSVRLGSATAYLDDYLWGTNASFWVWKVPLVPFIPVFAASLRKDRHSGLLAPSFGNSSEKGFMVRQPIYWAIADNQDLTLVPTYYTKVGFGLGGSYRYVRREGSRGELEGFAIWDSDRDETRWVLGARHDEQLTSRLSFKADLGFVSDDQFFDDFGNTLDDRSRQRLESNVSLTQRWDKWNFVGRLFFYEDLTTDKAVELQRLPELKLNAFQQPVPGLPDLLFEMESSYDNFVREIGSDGQRLDLRPRLSYPFSPGGFFTVTPRVGVRGTVYDTKVQGVKVEEGFLVEDTTDEWFMRGLFEAAVDLEARAYRNFDLGGALGIQRIQHAIEPRVTWNYVTGDDGREVPQWDSIDVARSTHNLTYSLTNRLKARGVGEGDQPGRVWELARLTLSQSWELDEPEPVLALGGVPIVPVGPTRRLSDLFADLILEPLYGIRFRGTAAFDVYDQVVSSATIDASYEAKNWRAAIGTRHGRDGELEFIQGAVEARLGARWSARFASNYDTVAKTVIENRLEVTFREQCWAISAAIIDRADEDEFRITINLLELGQYGFGRAFGSQ